MFDLQTIIRMSRNVMDERIEFDPGWSLLDCQAKVRLLGKDWRLGRFEWNGRNFSWTPFGDETHWV